MHLVLIDFQSFHFLIGLLLAILAKCTDET